MKLIIVREFNSQLSRSLAKFQICLKCCWIFFIVCRWSFGIVLFELTTYGATPYPTIDNKDLLKELKSGYRMDRPANCPEHL